MKTVETRESIESQEPNIAEDRTENSRLDPQGISSYNTAARTVHLRDEALRFPVGLSLAAQEKLVAQSLPTLDRLLESGKEKRALIAAIDGATYKPELPEEERAERFKPSAKLVHSCQPKRKFAFASRRGIRRGNSLRRRKFLRQSQRRRN
jgi:hypothetical protein